jgi:hypothetical protein
MAYGPGAMRGGPHRFTVKFTWRDSEHLDIEVRCLACGSQLNHSFYIQEYCHGGGDQILVPRLDGSGESEEVKTALALATLHILAKGGSPDRETSR